MSKYLSDNELLEEVKKIEDELYSKGLSPRQRQLKIPRILMEQLGLYSPVFTGTGEAPYLSKIRAIQNKLYRQQDELMSPIHAGIFMFKGFPGKITIPHLYGQARIDPFQMSDFSEVQIRWIHENDNDIKAFVAEFSNIFDLAMTVNPSHGFQLPQKKIARNYFRNSIFHFQSATSVLCSAFDTRGAVQSSLLACELALKATLLEYNATEKEVKGLGHCLMNLSKQIHNRQNSYLLDDNNKLINKLPQYVPNRYSDEQPDAMETGKILMATQKIAADASRLVTKKTIRTDFFI